MGWSQSPATQLYGDKSVVTSTLPTEDKPSVSEIAGAFFRQENIIGSSVNQEVGLPDTKDNSTFDAYAQFTEAEKLDEQFVSAAIFADDDQEIEAVRKQIARERRDREIMAKGGATSFVVGLPVMMADPLSLLSVGGVALNTYRAGKSILSGAAVTGSVVGIDTAIQEAALHTQQLTRTYGESAINISGGMLLGGVLGATASKLAEAGADKAFLDAVEDTMNVEPKIANGINPTTNEPLLQVRVEEIKNFKNKLIQNETERLLGEAGEVLTVGQRKKLQGELKNFKYDLEQAKNPPINVVARKGESARRVKQKVQKEELKNIQDKIDIIENKLLISDKALDSKKALSRLEQGILPMQAQSKLDDFLQLKKNELTSEPKIADEINPATNEPLNGGSIGAAKTRGDQQVSGKLAEGLLKLMPWDPVASTITSNAPATRITANLLAENVIKMDGEAVQSAGQLAGLHAGKLGIAVEQHVNLLAQYKKAGGKMTRKQFSEAVSTAIRTGESNIPEVKASADSWVKELYDPMKKEMIEQKLLPEDVDVATANNYLNRVWNKNKISTNFPQFVTKVSDWLEGQDVKLYEKAKAASAQVGKATGKEQAELQKVIDKAEFKKGMDFERQDYEALAEEIAQRIQGSPDGRLPYDWKLGGGSKGGGVNNQGISGTALRGPLRNRVFQIPDELVEEFLENDVEILGPRFLQNVSGDVELVKMFGDVNMTDQLKDINSWYAKKKNDASLTPKQQQKLEKQREQDVKNIAGMRDRLRGVYGYTEDNLFTRTMRASRDLNYLRLLGGVTVTSFPDVARVFMAEGFVRTFKSGLLPLIANTKAFNVSAAESKRYGIGSVALTRRSAIIADVADYAQGNTAFERGLSSASRNFGRINLLDRWTAGMKQLHAVTMQTSVFDSLKKGKFDKRLERLGINKQSAQDMWEQVEKYGEKTNGVWITNAKNWDRPDLERMWGAAVRKESDRVIVVPGQEKPLFMSRPMGQTIGQFKSFILSTNQRMVIASLQGQDHNAIGGFSMLVGMGAFTYFLKQKESGREISDDPAVWVMEGIDRSGAIGMLSEVNGLVEKISSNSVGLRPLLGISSPASKQVSRSIAENLAGPTFGGLLTTVIQAINAVASGEEVTDSDIRAMRRLIIYQNLTGFREIVDRIEEAAQDL